MPQGHSRFCDPGMLQPRFGELRASRPEFRHRRTLVSLEPFFVFSVLDAARLLPYRDSLYTEDSEMSIKQQSCELDYTEVKC
jgi:hypothetical protein